MNNFDIQLTSGLVDVKKPTKDVGLLSQDIIYVNDLAQTNTDSVTSTDVIVSSSVVDNSEVSSAPASRINPYYVPENNQETVSDPDVIVDYVEIVVDPKLIIDPVPEMAIPVEWLKPYFIGTDGIYFDPDITGSIPSVEVGVGVEVVDPSLAGKNGSVPENLTDPICTIMPIDPEFGIDPIVITDPLVIDPEIAICPIMPIDPIFILDTVPVDVVVEPIAVVEPVIMIDPVDPGFSVDLFPMLDNNSLIVLGVADLQTQVI